MTERHHALGNAVWDDPMHVGVSDFRFRFPDYLLRRHYERLNEGRLLQMFRDRIDGDKFFEIGCATGEFFRYIDRYMKQFQYSGFDVSRLAIERAKERFPRGGFHLLTTGVEEIEGAFGRPDVLWCRDVVVHQERPYEFMSKLIELSRNVVLLRLRTRDVGETVTDSALSCQLHWDKFWVPYVVLNTQEMIEKISMHADVRRIVLSRHYEVLGGHNNRFVPKELYSTDARAAETAVFIQKGERTEGAARDNVDVEITFMDQQDCSKGSILDRVVRRAIGLFSPRPPLW